MGYFTQEFLQMILNFIRNDLAGRRELWNCPTRESSNGRGWPEPDRWLCKATHQLLTEPC
jgi:hypothetical protein